MSSVVAAQNSARADQHHVAERLARIERRRRQAEGDDHAGEGERQARPLRGGKRSAGRKTRAPITTKNGAR